MFSKKSKKKLKFSKQILKFFPKSPKIFPKIFKKILKMPKRIPKIFQKKSNFFLRFFQKSPKNAREMQSNKASISRSLQIKGSTHRYIFPIKILRLDGRLG